MEHAFAGQHATETGSNALKEFTELNQRNAFHCGYQMRQENRNMLASIHSCLSLETPWS